MPATSRIAHVLRLAVATWLVALAASALEPRRLSFEENRGQAACPVRFLARGPGQTLLLEPDGLVLLLSHVGAPGAPVCSGNRRDELTVESLRMRFGGLPDDVSELRGLDPLPGTVNLIRGRDPKTWRTGIPTFGRVEYRRLYPGIDAIFRQAETDGVEFDLLLQRASDSRAIRFEFDGADGVELDGHGGLSIRMPSGSVVGLSRPRVFQERAGRSSVVPARYEIDCSGVARVRIEDAEAALPLLIDPTLAVSSFLGGTESDRGWSIARDATGAILVAGYTLSPDFPLVAPFQGAYQGRFDAFVAKLDPTGSMLQFATYLGGADRDEAVAVVADDAGNVYVTGWTQSDDFPVLNPIEPALHGFRPDIFVSELNPSGSTLVFSTYFGGSGEDLGDAIAVDSARAIYVAGRSYSFDFPAVRAAQAGKGGPNGSDACVFKLEPAGGAVVYSTYLGGSGADEGATGLAVDAAGRASVGGFTNSTDFPVLRPIQASLKGPYDAFLTQFDAAGAMAFSTYFGGSGHDHGSRIAVDRSDRIWMTGRTFSSDFPLRDPIQALRAGGNDAFVLGLEPGGAGLAFSTYLGGSAQEQGMGIAITQADKVLVAGITDSPDFPAICPEAASRGGGLDVFAVLLDPARPHLDYATAFGGAGDDFVLDVTEGAPGFAWITGETASADYPTTLGAFQPTLAGKRDAFVTSIFDDPRCAVAVTCPADRKLECPADTAPATTGSPSPSGGCAPLSCSYSDTVTPSCGGTVEIARRWSCSDGCKDDTCRQVINTIDSTSPALVVPAPLMLECDLPGGIPASDPRIAAWLAAAVATDACSDVVLANDAPSEFPPGCPRVGVVQVTFTATDGCDNASTGASTVAVDDTTPPNIEKIGFEGICLWPPNHDFYCIDDVAKDVGASDLCDPDPPTVRVVSCKSSQPETGNGSGNFEPDCLLLRDGVGVCVRSERDGSDPEGRIYTLRIGATDRCDNLESRDIQIYVPRDQSPKDNCRRPNRRKKP